MSHKLRMDTGIEGNAKCIKYCLHAIFEITDSALDERTSKAVDVLIGRCLLALDVMCDTIDYWHED